ncbi:MAG: hypothetical protein C5B46_02580 [Proteobacteria bacterium]|nr:MAG: hypothetical protein C5B46_02580 [Pseudomonadota bacterium]
MSEADRDERELEAMLYASSALRKRYREAAADEPSEHVDAAIHAAARRAVRARPTEAGSPFGGSWRVPLSIAAVVVISVTLTFLVLERSDQPAPRSGGDRSKQLALPEADSKTTSQGTVMPTAPVRQAAPSPSSPPPLRDEPVDGALRKQRSTPVLQSKDEPAKLREAPAASRGAPAANVAGASKEPLREQAAQSDVDETRAESQAPVEAKQESYREKPAAEPEADRETQPRSSVAAPAPQEQAKRSDALSTARERSSDAQPFPSPTVAAKAPAQAAASAPPWESGPEAWLRHIDELRAQGLLADARVSFEGFRRRYPDYELPKGFSVP